MRNAFVEALTMLAEQDERVALLTADLGFKIFDGFARRFPERFYNVGVAEANMIGAAAGMAMDGMRPFAYSIVPFATLRCLEQIRNDVCYHRLPVTVVGVGGGFSYGPNGPTHHALEDIGVMRMLPNMTVICPGDPIEVKLAVLETGTVDGPVYLRLGRAGDPIVHRTPPEFRIGRSITVQEGSDCALISTGGILPLVTEVARKLGDAGVQARVISMHTVKPLDVDALDRCCAEGLPLFTVEEHGRAGGLGSALGEWLAESGRREYVMSIACKDEFAHRTGSQEFLRASNGLTADSIASRIALAMEQLTC